MLIKKNKNIISGLETIPWGLTIECKLVQRHNFI